MELQRTRTRTSKTRKGCLTCKQRHIRCDETNRGVGRCNNCSRANRLCQYADVWRLKTVPSGNQNSPASLQQGLIELSGSSHSPFVTHRFPLQHPPTSNVPAGDLLLFEYFRTQVVPGLADGLEGAFWSSNILQVGKAQTIVRHSALAIAALHRTHHNVGRSVDDNERLRLSALQHYDRAIGKLMKLNAIDLRKDMIPVLMTCILLIYFEILRDDFTAARAHIKGGIKILQEHWESDQFSERHGQSANLYRLPDPEYFGCLDTIRLILTRIDFQASVFQPSSSDDDTIRFRSKLRQFDTSDLKKPLQFSSVPHAEAFLDYLMQNSIRIKAMHEPALEEAERNMPLHMRINAEHTFTRWKEAVRHLSSDRSDLSSDAKRDSLILEIRHKSKDILLGAYNSTALSQEILALTEQISNLSIESGAELRRTEQRVFLLKNEINIPLFLVAWKCSEPDIRRQAISQLETRCTVEGLWSSRFLADTAKKIASIEEHGMKELGEEGCTSNRARVDRIEIVPDNTSSGRLRTYLVSRQ